MKYLQEYMHALKFIKKNNLNQLKIFRKSSKLSQYQGLIKSPTSNCRKDNNFKDLNLYVKSKTSKINKSISTRMKLNISTVNL